MKIKYLLFTVFFIGIIGVGYYFLIPEFDQEKAVGVLSNDLFGWKFPVTKFPSTGSGQQIAYSDIRDPGGVPRGLPVRLKIPIIGVDSAIEDALITPDGRMDVPAGSKNVAWFSLGPPPGQVGSAVIGGHFGISGGVPFVFYKLDKLKVGDKIYIEDDSGDTISFIVRSISLFNRNADATTVFTSDDGLAHLNLITCEGIWNQVDDTYPERRVVFTDAVPREDIIVPKIEAITTFYRSLTIGSRGTDVAALQTFLEEKRFLTIPKGVTKGFFGRLTRSALTKYQISVGLPSVGIFDPPTRNKLISDLESLHIFPDAGIDSVFPISTEVSSAFPQIFIQSIESLYTTPIDGFITSVLLILIIFVGFKIIAR